MIREKRTGFTIVELLIVVVVIAILAAITIVAFNGIQTRAKDTQAVAAVSEYVKGLKAYRSANGTIPYYGSVSCFDGTSCWSGSSVPNATSMRADLVTVMGNSLPTIPAPFAALITNATTPDTLNGGNYTGYYVLYQHSNTGSCQPVGGLRYLNYSIDNGRRSCRAALE